MAFGGSGGRSLPPEMEAAAEAKRKEFEEMIAKECKENAGGGAKRSNPRMVMCYICGREFGKTSIDIHEKQCAKKWEDTEAQKPPRERKPLPQKPQIGEGATLEERNAAIKETFESQSMSHCPVCNRRFKDETTMHRHLKTCKSADGGKYGPTTFGTGGGRQLPPEIQAAAEAKQKELEEMIAKESQKNVRGGGNRTGPRAVMCYICGREFGKTSIDIHEKQCAKKWQDAEAQKPPRERKPLPQKPQLADGATLEERNAAIKEVYEAQAMAHCPTCGRRFKDAETMRKHQSTCKGGDGHTQSNEFSSDGGRGLPPEVQASSRETGFEKGRGLPPEVQTIAERKREDSEASLSRETGSESKQDELVLEGISGETGQLDVKLATSEIDAETVRKKDCITRVDRPHLGPPQGTSVHSSQDFAASKHSDPRPAQGRPASSSQAVTASKNSERPDFSSHIEKMDRKYIHEALDAVQKLIELGFQNIPSDLGVLQGSLVATLQKGTDAIDRKSESPLAQDSHIAIEPPSEQRKGPPRPSPKLASMSVGEHPAKLREEVSKARDEQQRDREIDAELDQTAIDFEKEHSHSVEELPSVDCDTKAGEVFSEQETLPADQQAVVEGQPEHNQCFLCCSCNSTISESYFDDESGHMCKACHEQKAPICVGCGRRINDCSYSIVESEPYHYECFTCCACSDQISGSYVKVPDGYMCERCNSDAAPKCAACHRPVSGNYITINDEAYHDTCFRCNDCDEPISGAYFRSDGRLLCESCGKHAAS